MSGPFRLLLVYPNIPFLNPPPVGIGSLAAAVKKDGHCVKVFDQTFYKGKDPDSDKAQEEVLGVRPFEFEPRTLPEPENDAVTDFLNVVEDYEPDLIGISILESTWDRAVELLDGLIGHDVPVLAGGVFPTFAQEIVLSHPAVDIVCVGEGEGPIVDLCRKLKNGEDYDSIQNLWVKNVGGTITKNRIRPALNISELDVPDYTTHTLMLLNGTQLTLQSERKKYGLETHFRILPRDFGKLSNGAYPVEIEEVVTSTSAMSFDDYCALRIMHLIINVTYNGKAFGPLFKFFRETCISVFDLITALVQNTYNANPEVQEVIDSFSRKTLSELWESRKDLQAYAATEDAHKQLLNEEVGENLIQTHTARSTRIMSEWAKYVFDTANTICADKKLNHEELAMLDEIRLFCTSRVHDIWGLDRGENNPIHKFSYDIADWYSSEKSSLPLSAFKLGNKKWIEFRYSNDKLQEIDDFIGLLGTTNTGLGRILIKTDITKLWREPVTVTPPIEFYRGSSTEVDCSGQPKQDTSI